MKSKYLYGVLLMVLIVLSAGCKKLVEVNPPVNQLVTTNVFTNTSSATAAQLAVYVQMSADLINLSRFTALSSDEIVSAATDNLTKDLYQNALTAARDASGLTIWSNSYKYIYQENAILENLQNSSALPVNVKNLLMGEAKFMRAFWYFYLVNLYGNVPLVTTTDYTVNSTMRQSSPDQVYAQIVSDLTEAKGLLSTDFLDASNNSATTERVRPTAWAASALLSRVYLYMGKYDSAESESTIVLNNTTQFQLLSNLNDVFLSNSMEAIWQVQPTTTTGATAEGYIYVLAAKPASGANAITISPILLNAFEANDARKSNWVGTFTSGASSWKYLNKYKYKTNNNSEYSMVLRLAEIYLVRAEARAKQNKLSGAITDLNMIRTRAGLPGIASSSTQQQVMDGIVHERQVELFGEAHRWMDLKRWKTIDNIMSTVTPLKGGTSWNSFQQLYPIPVSDIQRNNNLVQNPGY